MSIADDTILIRKKLSRSIKECEKHIGWAKVAMHYIEDLFPLTVECYQKLKNSEEALISLFQTNDGYDKLGDIKTGHFDQFLYRYTKLQDTIGANIIRPLSMLLEYSDRTLSFIDCLNILEKYSIIESTKSFEKLRDIRNAITHEYSDSIEEQVNTLNNVYASYNTLLIIFENIKIAYNNN